MSNTFTYTKQIGNLTNFQSYLQSNFTGITSINYDNISFLITVIFSTIIISGDIPELNKAVILYNDAVGKIYDLNVIPVQTSNNSWTVIKSWNFPSNENDLLYIWTALNITSWITNRKVLPSTYDIRLMNITNNTVIVSGNFSNTSSVDNSLTIPTLPSSLVLSLELQVKVNVVTDVLNIKSIRMIY